MIIKKFFEYHNYNYPKGFEILEFLYNDDIIIRPGHIEYEDCIKDCLKSEFRDDVVTINKVKRLSDGAQFKVGEIIKDTHGHIIGRISKIWILGDQVRADIGNLGLVLNNDFLVPLA